MRTSIKVRLALAGLIAAVMYAQEEDGPGRGVARLSLINGDVSVRRGDSGDWVAGAVNAPLVVEDAVLTGPGSRAEIQFDWANMLRLGSNTEVRLSELEHRRYQVQLARGTVILRVLRDIDAELEVNTPSVSVRPVNRGAFRVTVTEQGESEITARSGEAEIYTPNGVEKLRSGRTMLVRGTPSSPEFRTIDALARDSFDRWSEDRDRYLERTRSYQYVSRDIYGADELDYYGRWVWVAPYGWVWTPWGVAEWWAPYRHGRWVWIDWYGWTWLSYDPWGWAPFHYGRWFWSPPYGWCWYPGPRHYRHFWRPALVAFFGFRVGGVHLGFGFGRIGWVPLAPYEPFYPWYGPRYYRGYRNPTYIDNSVRIVNNVHVVNVYRNARVVNAVSGVDHDGFARGGRIEPVRVQEGEFQRASLLQGPVPVVPAAESVRFADKPVRASNFLPRREPERFFARRPATLVERVPFEEQRRGVEQLVRRSLAGQGESASIAGGPHPVADAAPRAEGSALRRTEADARGWRRVNEQPGPARSNEERGWRRIGEPARQAGPEAAETQTDRSGWRWVGEPRRTESGNLPRTGGADRGQWRRLGETEAGRPAAGDQAGWRRFGASGAPASEAQKPEELSGPRRESPRWLRTEPRSEPRRSESYRAEPIFINPPMVRERNPHRVDGAYRGPAPERSGGAPHEGGTVRGAPSARSEGSSRSAEAGPRAGGRAGRIR